MGGRAKPNWAWFEGGPLHGRRELLHPDWKGTRAFYTPAAPGMRTPHEYRSTLDIKPSEDRNSAKCTIWVFVRTLPDEVEPPPPPTIWPSLATRA